MRLSGWLEWLWRSEGLRLFRRTAAAAAILTLAAEAEAQSFDDRYPWLLAEDELAPEVETDTTLFRLAANEADDLFAMTTGYRLSFVEYRRRNRSRYDSEAIYEGARLPVRYGYTLRRLGAGMRRIPESSVGAYGRSAEEYTFGRYDDRPSTVAATLTDRGYSAGVAASTAARFGRGWSLDAAIGARTGRDLHIDGLFLNSATIALRAAKLFADGSQLSLLATAEPSERGLRSASTAEAFRLTGNNLYNPAWGWYNGRQRNSRVRRHFTPLAVAAYSADITTATRLTATAAFEGGTRRQSSLGWYDAATPQPDYYRSMPDAITRPESAAEVEAAWRAGDTRYTQIDWEELCRVNRMSDRGAVYALDDRVSRTTDIQATVAAVTRPAFGVSVNYGITARYDSDRRYRQMRDLLGAPYLRDLDYYLIDDDSYSNSLQNDLRNPDRTVTEGDRFGYDYAFRRMRAAAFASAEYSSGRFDIAFAGRIGTVSVHRRGFCEKELFAGSGSYGNSERMNFTEYDAALTAGWTLSPRTRLAASLSAAAEAPRSEALFLNPQYNNRTAGGIGTQRRTSAEISARTALRRLRMQASVFVTAQHGGAFAMQYYDDLAGSYCDMSVSGIDILTFGIEAAATAHITSRWHVQAAITALQCRYTSNPLVRIWTDSDNTVVDPGSASHMGDCIPGGTPRLAAVLAVTYRSANGWSATLAAEWAGARAVDPSPLRRTERVAYQAAGSPESFAQITRQESLPDAVSVDLRIAKRWFIGRNSRITAALSVQNLTGERNNIHSAYESHRVRRIARGIQTDYIPLPTRYLYSYPRSILLSATYSF